MAADAQIRLMYRIAKQVADELHAGRKEIKQVHALMHHASEARGFLLLSAQQGNVYIYIAYA